MNYFSFFIFMFSSLHISCQTDIVPKTFFQFENEAYHYQDLGSGDEVILFLHGFALSSFSYTDIIGRFDHSKYRLIALDLKGNGFSAKPKHSDYSVEKQASLIQELARFLDIKSLNLVGHSYGGMISLFLNYQQTKNKLAFNIKSTTLIDTPAYNKNIPLFIKLIKTKIGNFTLLKLPPLFIRTRIAIRGGFYDYKEGFAKHMSTYKIILGQKEYAYTLNQLAKHAIPDNFNEIIASYQDFDIPILILWGKHDKFINIKHAQRLHKDIENSELILIEETAHNPHEEKPEIVFQLINNFIEQNL